MVISLELIFPKMTSFWAFLSSTVQTFFSAVRQNLLEHLWTNVSQTLREMRAWHLKNETLCPSYKKKKKEKKGHLQIMELYLMSVSSSTTMSHLVFGTELFRNRWRIANVFPQWPANRDMVSIDWPVRLNHILTMCCIRVLRR